MSVLTTIVSTVLAHCSNRLPPHRSFASVDAVKGTSWSLQHHKLCHFLLVFIFFFFFRAHITETYSTHAHRQTQYHHCFVFTVVCPVLVKQSDYCSHSVCVLAVMWSLWRLTIVWPKTIFVVSQPFRTSLGWHADLRRTWDLGGEKQIFLSCPRFVSVTTKWRWFSVFLVSASFSSFRHWFYVFSFK